MTTILISTLEHTLKPITIYRGCDLKIFRPDRRSDEFRASKGINEHDVAIIWVGRLVPEKRPDIWMDVVKRLQVRIFQ